jgi:hypothetical protein
MTADHTDPAKLRVVLVRLFGEAEAHDVDTVVAEIERLFAVASATNVEADWKRYNRACYAVLRAARTMAEARDGATKEAN